jgi:hypothetical protein
MAPRIPARCNARSTETQHAGEHAHRQQRPDAGDYGNRGRAEQASGQPAGHHAFYCPLTVLRQRGVGDDASRNGIVAADAKPMLFSSNPACRSSSRTSSASSRLSKIPTNVGRLYSS